MVNATVINATYDLTNIIGADAIEHPELWLGLVNNAVGGWIIVSLMAIFGIVIFVWQRNNDVPDSEALLYSGIITTILVFIMFAIDTGIPGIKLITWAQTMPFFVITAIALFANHFNKKY